MSASKSELLSQPYTVDLTGLSTTTGNIGLTSASASGYTWNMPLSAPSPVIVGTSPVYGQYTNYMHVDYMDTIVNSLFCEEEKEEWLVANGYEKTDFIKFNEHAKARLKSMLLAPKQEIKIKVPKVD